MNTRMWHEPGGHWWQVPMPPWWHKCHPQSWGTVDDAWVERCACGAVRVDQGLWRQRNSRKGTK